MGCQVKSSDVWEHARCNASSRCGRRYSRHPRPLKTRANPCACPQISLWEEKKIGLASRFEKSLDSCHCDEATLILPTMNGDQGTAIKVHTFEHFALIRPTRCAVCQAFIVRTCHTSPRVLFSVPYSRIAILGGAPRRPGPYLLPLRALRSSSSPFTSSASIPTSHAACATLRLRTLWWHTCRTTERFFDPTPAKAAGNTRPHQVVLCLPLATASIRSRIPR